MEALCGLFLYIPQEFLVLPDEVRKPSRPPLCGPLKPGLSPPGRRRRLPICKVARPRGHALTKLVQFLCPAVSSPSPALVTTSHPLSCPLQDSALSDGRRVPVLRDLLIAIARLRRHQGRLCRQGQGHQAAQVPLLTEALGPTPVPNKALPEGRTRGPRPGAPPLRRS